MTIENDWMITKLFTLFHFIEWYMIHVLAIHFTEWLLKVCWNIIERWLDDHWNVRKLTAKIFISDNASRFLNDSVTVGHMMAFHLLKPLGWAWGQIYHVFADTFRVAVPSIPNDLVLCYCFYVKLIVIYCLFSLVSWARFHQTEISYIAGNRISPTDATSNIYSIYAPIVLWLHKNPRYQIK